VSVSNEIERPPHAGPTLALGLFLAGTLVALFGLVLLWLNRGHTGPNLVWGTPGFNFVYPFGFAAVGLLLAARRPRNPIGWIFLVAGLVMVAQSTAQQYAVRSLVSAPGSLPLGRPVGWVGSWLWVPASFSIALIALIFPTGRLLSRRWRPLLWFVCVYAAGITIAAAIATGPPGSFRLYGFSFGNPKGAAQVALTVLGVGSSVVLAVCLSSLVVRTRRARGDEREQLKWLGVAAALPLLVLVPSLLIGARWLEDILIVTILAVPAAAAVAILKYHLYDIEVVITKTVVYGALAILIGIVYVGLAVGVGALVGSHGSPNLALSLLAAALVAIGFQPARTRLERLANRLVYGERATPYETLSDFTARVASSDQTAEILPRLARLVAQATGATAVRVWLRDGDVLRPEATWPPAKDPAEPIAGAEDPVERLVASDRGTRAFLIRHEGELLGALTVKPSPTEPLTPGSERLVSDLASQTGLVVHFEHLRERALYARALAAFLPPDVARMVEQTPSALSLREEVEATILFSDIRGFSALAERLPPLEMAEAVGRHIRSMAEVVDLHGGTLDKFAGDAVMAVFGIPRRLDDHAERALRCAVAMQQRQQALNAEATALGIPTLEIGIGVNSGTVIAGTLGGPGRLDYTVLGDAVNVAQRLQAEAIAGEILVSAATAENSSNHLLEEAGTRQLKGRTEPVLTYRVLWTDSASESFSSIASE